MVTGAFVGVIAAAIVTMSSPIDPAVGFWPTFGFFGIFGFGLGLVLGGLVGVAIDARTRSTRGVAHITETRERPARKRTPKN